MKKILFFVESLSGGGAEKVLTDLVINLDKKKYDITVCSLVDIGVYNEVLKKVCTYTYILPNTSKSSALKKILFAIRYKLVHLLPPKFLYKRFFKDTYDAEVAFIEGYSTKIISASNNPDSKKIAWVHIDLEANHWTQIEYKNLQEEINSYKKFDHIVSVAKSVQDAFSRKFGIKENLLVKYNPVDREDILSKSKESIHLKPSKHIRLVTVGRLEPQKGYDRLLEIVKKLNSEGINFELWIVGEGSKRKELEDYIEKHSLNSIVTLQGFQKNPYKFIEASDAFICSSRSEGFSTVVTEALILGKPVVATNCSGMEELLGHSEFGLITNNNTEDLYKGLKEFLNDKDLRTHYTKKSKERSASFDIKQTVKSIEELL